MLNVISPAEPPTTGVEIPTVIFLADLASPCSWIELVSMPSSDVDVTLLVNSVGPSNLDNTSLSVPPDTFRLSA